MSLNNKKQGIMDYSPIADILIVEDDELNRELIIRRLDSPLYQLRYAVDGQQALDQVATQKPDLILLDIMLPEIMGLQVLHTLRQRYSMVDLPVIMVTAIDEDQRIVRALEVGANDYVTKPINFPILQARMQTQLSLKQLSAMNNEFLSTASRDLQKPLDDILLVAKLARHQLASSETLEPSSLYDKLSDIVQSAQYIQNISHYVLQTQSAGFAQLRLTRSPLPAEQIINGAIERHLSRAAEKNITLISRHSSQPLTVEVDKSRLEQAIDYLLLERIEQCQPQAHIYLSARAQDQDVYIEICDDNSQLSTEEQHSLSDNEIESMEDQSCDDELGETSPLAISRQIIEQHQGSVGIETNEDGGCHCWFRLPAFRLKPID